MNELSTIQQIAVGIIPMLFAITVHETAHGWVAKQYGDNTAYMLGRLTLNPVKHIDPLGTIILPGFLLLTGTNFIFGWAKPVPVNARNLKKPVSDMAVVALAGPVSNFLMALFWALLIRLSSLIFGGSPAILEFLVNMGIFGISVNLSLGLLNLIPIPPLDGSRIVTAFLPYNAAMQYNQLERYGFLILLVLLSTDKLGLVLAYPFNFFVGLFITIAGLN